MFNPYQTQGQGFSQGQGNAFSQQSTGFYPGNGQQQQQPQQPQQPHPQLNQRPTTEFGTMQQNVPSSFGFQQQQQPQQQQQQQQQQQPPLPNFSNAGNQFSNSSGFGGNQQSYGYPASSNGIQPQQTGYSQALQPQQTGQFSQQVPQTSFFNQAQNQFQPQATQLQQQQQQSQTGNFFEQPLSNHQYQQPPFPNQTLQSQNTGYYPPQQAQQQLQPQSTGFPNQSQGMAGSQPLQLQQTNQYSQQSQPAQSHPTGFYPQQGQNLQQSQQSQQSGFQSSQQQPLQPQQTGFYAQQPQQTGFHFGEPVQPLKPTATGFVNSFANNGINDSLKIPLMRLSFMTAADQAKFETLFRSSVPQGSNTISGGACRGILMRSGVSPSQLAKIWTLCDTSKAGELLFPEFALAMHLVNEVIQGDSVPFDLNTKVRNEVASFVDAINVSIAGGSESNVSQPPRTPFDDLTFGVQNLQPQPTGAMPQISFGTQLQPQNTQGPLNPQLTGYLPPTSFNQMQPQQTGGQLQPQLTNQFQQPAVNGPLQSQLTGGFLQSQATGMMPPTSFNQPLQSQLTGAANLQPQNTGSFAGLSSVLTGQPTGQQGGQFLPSAPFSNSSFLQSQTTGYLPPSNFNPTAPLSAQKTGYGHNELYSQTNMANKFMQADTDSLTREEMSLFYKMFDTYDTSNKGILGSDIAVEIFRKSGLNRSDLEQIWNLCDTNNSGQLNKQEFALGMHLVYKKLKGGELPNRLPPSLIPSSTRILNSVISQMKNDTNSTKKEPTKIDGFSFKHDDDELLPSSRNRRKTQPTQINSPQANSASTFQATPREPLDTSRSSQVADKNDELAIEDLSRKILALPLPNSTSDYDAKGLPQGTKEKFDLLTNKVPRLLEEISEVNNQITMAKIDLYRQRNPSSLVGTGQNGEVTDDDRRKARSKALLASRMAALTGKPSTGTDVDQQEQRYNEEVANIQSQNRTNKSIIEDIQASIFEIAAAVNYAIEGKAPVSGREYEKWELGVGVDPRVRFLLSKLNSKVSPQTIGYRGAKNTGSGSSSPAPAAASQSTPSDRSAYLKEQAQRKMRERLANLGLGKKNVAVQPDRSGKDEDVNRLPDRLDALESKPSSTSRESNAPAVISSNPVPAASSYPTEGFQSEVVQNGGGTHLAAHESANPGQNLDAVKEGGHSSEQRDKDPSVNVAPAPKIAATPQPTTNSVKHNPFGVPRAGSVASTPTGGRNPFFKSSQSSSSSFDAKAAEAQRRIQRGLDDDDDDWSDDDKKVEETTARGTPASVASEAAPVAPATAPVAPTPEAPAPVAPAPVAPAPVAPAPVAPAPVAPAPVAPAPVAPAPVAATPNGPAPPNGAPVPIAPPLPQIGTNPGNPVQDAAVVPANLAVKTEDDQGDRSDDDLSIPESVDSFTEAQPPQGGSVPSFGIPPPPPLP
ncbi:actin cytoskeleton-regulatory complex protein PAN1 LALA0_S01e09186g [Lachancea lanzarotensis]|uniref:Actin cytoskeleton-regulatory complex protein PAN1 n=1 Tax=Lachancea lanzarotensis TaxID=1245769 RepID=A0A0C7MY18_9SACH|nr:uncharacterized protein LALA0_S01e09186g [Lachancea lanzarotensis]CEP60370.1 LALA0S01e09186g1_1 [Lachancea lanzarotensis]